jgi:hypothetical protein
MAIMSKIIAKPPFDIACIEYLNICDEALIVIRLAMFRTEMLLVHAALWVIVNEESSYIHAPTKLIACDNCIYLLFCAFCNRK